MTSRVRAFVDGIDNGTARLVLDGGGRSFTLPANLLPEDAAEGRFVEITFTTLPPEEGTGESIRRKLSQDDDGGDLKL